MPTPKAPAEPVTDPRMDDVLARVAKLEESLRGVLSGKVAEISQEEKDQQTLRKRPNSYPEALEFEQAKQRQAERDAGRGKSAEPADETPPA